MADAGPARPGLSASPSQSLKGRVRAPGDKSISHRALILGALAHGGSEIEGLLEGEDVRRSAGAMRAFGARVERIAEGRWRVEGSGGFAEPGDVIDCGNAGTAARLILGASAGFGLSASFTGDASLRARPMGRVLRPLGLMGARWFGRAGDRLPLTLAGGALQAIRYVPPEPSAQVKSAVLLAALQADGVSEVIEPQPTRDHTERMLAGFGVQLEISQGPQGRSVRLAGGQKLSAMRIQVPGDPSSAAFPLVAALVTPDSEVTVEGVLLNPLRIGLFTSLREMDADLTIANVREAAGESVGDVTARSSSLRGVVIPPERAPSMIDEYPILAVAAAFARGETVMRGVGELRVKESDRLALMATGLAACGADVQEEPEGLIVAGTGGANVPARGDASIITRGDHRIAMSFLIMGLATQRPVAVDEAGMIATSFPGFVELMDALGAQITAL